MPADQWRLLIRGGLTDKPIRNAAGMAVCLEFVSRLAPMETDSSPLRIQITVSNQKSQLTGAVGGFETVVSIG